MKKKTLGFNFFFSSGQTRSYIAKIVWKEP